MAIFKRGGVYWISFWWRGHRVQKTTRQGSTRVAREMESALRTSLAKGELGLIERKPAPRLKDFAQRFMDTIAIRCAAKPRTVEFYAQQLARLLDFTPLANARLSDIDEQLIERFIHHRSRDVSVATVNRALATLRRLLRLAHEWHIIDRVPRVRLLPGEMHREFVLSYAQEAQYLAVAPPPLRSVATLILDTGLRIGEALAVRWCDVHHRRQNGNFGYVQIREGKSRNACRAVPLTSRAYKLLHSYRGCASEAYVFTDEHGQALTVSYLDHLHAQVRKQMKLPSEFVMHSLRHTYLTRLGLAGVEAFTIMRLAGHSSVTISQRYVHPTGHAVEHAISRLDEMNQRAASQLTPPVSTTNLLKGDGAGQAE